MFVTFDVTHEPMSWSNKDADSNIALMSTTLLVSQPEISALKSGYWEKASTCLWPRLVSQLGIGPKLAEPQLPSDPPRRHSDIAEAKLSSLSTEPNEGADDGGIPEQSKTHSQSFIAPSLELGHSKPVKAPHSKRYRLAAFSQPFLSNL